MSLHQSYMPADDAGKGGWLLNFKTKLPLYASVLNISTATLSQLNDDYTNYDASLRAVSAITAYKKNVVKFKDEVKNGKANDVALSPLAAAPALPAFTATILGDVFGRIALLVKNIKSTPAYTDNVHIGEDLKIIGADPAPVHGGTTTLPTERAAVLKPVLKIKLNKGNRPWIKWKKGHTHALKIWVDRADGHGFVLLTVATHHTYTDMFTLPAAGVAVVWKYKAVYLDTHEDEEGMYSEVAQITVTGV